MPTLLRAPEGDGHILQVEWDHPAADGLVGLWVPGCPINIANGKEPKFRTTVRGRANGLSGRFAGTVSTDSRIVTVGSNWGFATAFTTGTAATTSAIVGINAASGAGEGFGFHATHSSATYAGAIYAGSSYSVIGKPTGGALSNNTRYVIGASRAGSNGRVYRNGIVTASAGSLSAPPACAVLTLGLHSNGTGGWTVSPDFEYFILWGKAPSPAVFLEVARDWRRLLRRSSVLAPAAGGGTDYPVTRTESADASDTASLTIIYAATAAEIAEATSAHAAAMAAAASIAETGEATSTQAGALTAFVSIAETGAATDSASTAGLYGVTVAEASDAADVASAIRALFGTTSETGAATDTSSASLPGLYSVSVVEAANAEDEAAQAMSALVVIAEALAAADVANWVGAVIYTRAPRGGGYPATVQTTERYGTTNTKRPAMTNTRR